MSGQLFAGLAPAPPVTRGASVVRRRRPVAAGALVVLGVVVLVGVAASGLFSTVAGGQQMLDELRPHLALDALDRYDADLATLRSGAAAVEAVDLADGALPGADAWAAGADEIDGRASGLLAQVRAAVPDYREASEVTGFERVPLLVSAAGLVAVVAGVGLARGGRAGTLVAPLVLAAGLVLYPFVGGLWQGAGSTARLVTSFEDVMTSAQVEALQRDFVVLVHAVGELDTAYATTPHDPSADPDVAALVERWPEISSDLAELVGTLNDNLDRHAALEAFPAFTVVPWALVALGLLSAALAVAALPRRELP